MVEDLDDIVARIKQEYREITAQGPCPNPHPDPDPDWELAAQGTSDSVMNLTRVC